MLKFISNQDKSGNSTDSCEKYSPLVFNRKLLTEFSSQRFTSLNEWLQTSLCKSTLTNITETNKRSSIGDYRNKHNYTSNQSYVYYPVGQLPDFYSKNNNNLM